MVKIYKFIAYTLFFIVMSVLFLPKENLFFFLEKELVQKQIYISKEVLKEEAFGLEIKDMMLSYEGIDIVKVNKTEIETFLFYNTVFMQGGELSPLLSHYWPRKIESCRVVYSVTDPFVVKAVAKGDFGVIHAWYDIKTTILKVSLKASTLMLKKYQKSLRYFKRAKNGEYSYEKSL